MAILGKLHPNLGYPEVMDKKKSELNTPGTESTIIGRRRLSDITNTGVPLASNLKNTVKGVLSSPLSKGNATHLLKEIECLKKLLAEKEASVEYQTGETKKWWNNYCRASQQNRELVKTNSQMSKELALDREKLKLLRHEYKQMSAMYKAKIEDLEHKVNGMSRQLEGMQACERKGYGKKQDAQELQSKITSSSENSDLSTCKSGKFLNRDNGSLKPDGATNEENSSDKRICLRRRSAKPSYKEPSLLKKLRQQDQSDASTQTSSGNNVSGVSDDGLETLEKDSENEVQDVTSFLRSETTVKDLSTSGQFQDISDSTDSCQAPSNSLFSSMNISAVIRKTTRVKLEQHELEDQENLAPPSGSSLNVALEASHLSRRSLTGRPMRKAAEIVTSYKELPLKIKLRRPA